MKYKKLSVNPTVIIYNGIPYVLKQVAMDCYDDKADVCYYCDLRNECITQDGQHQFLKLCKPEFIGDDCCFIEDWDAKDKRIIDYLYD